MIRHSIFLRRFSTCLAVTLVLYFGSVSLYASGELTTAEVEALRMTLDSQWTSNAAPGYWPFRFDITNLGEDRTIEIVGGGSRWWNSGETETSEIHQTLALKRNDRKRFTVSIPVAASNESIGIQIRERGKTLHIFNYSSLGGNKTLEESSVLFVSSSASAVQDLLRPVAVPTYGAIVGGGASSSRPGTSPPLLDFVLDPSRLPTDWLGFTSLRAVFIGPREWEELEVAQKQALQTWVACGGDLFLVDGDPRSLFPEGIPSVSASGPNFMRYLFGRIFPVRLSVLAASGIADTLLNAKIAANDQAFALPANRSSDWLSFGERGFRLNIPGVGGIPVRSYLAILVVFSLLIVPVNYVMLWRKKKQVLLVLTTPLISVVFIVLLSGYAVLGEGFGIRERAQSFTILDQTGKRAATRASVSMYAAGIAPRKGLRFPREAAVFPVGLDGRGSRDPQILDLSELQQFSSGILRARAPANFEEISFRPARERLTFNRSGETIEVVNGLGATLNKLLYRSGGKTFTLERPLRDGEKGSLRAGGDWESAFPPAFNGAAGLNRRTGAGEADAYLAFLETSPFLDSGATVEERGSQHLVLGNPGGQP
jgi:hypothetical protein